MFCTKLKLPASLIFLISSLLTAAGYSATIKGKVLDAKTNETLIGTLVYNKDNKQIHDAAGLDGSYTLKNLAPGTYTIVAEFFGYVTQEKSVVIADNKQVITQDFLMDAQAVNLGQVQVISSYEKGSDNAARSAEKNADYIMNIMSAKTIQLMSDVTVGDVLVRMSGVVAEKSVTGGGKYAVIRGMDKRYNYTTINSVKVPSPDYKNRYVPMDIFPSEILERLEVIKTLTPDMEGDAIGGAMNLVLKDAPDHFAFDADLATGRDQTLFNYPYNKFDASVINPKAPNQINGPNYIASINDFPIGSMTYTKATVLPNILSGATIGNRFFNKKFGVLFSVNYQNVFSATHGFFIKPQSQPNYTPTYNTPLWDYNSSRFYSVQEQREAAHIKLDYEFNQKHKISFYTVYSGMNQYRSRIDFDTANDVPGSELHWHYQTKVTYQHILSSILQGTDSLAHNLLLDWTLASSRAWEDIPDWSDMDLLGTVGSPNAAFSTLSMVWMNNTDQDYSGYINLTYKFKIVNEKFEIKAGAMNRDKSRDAYYAEYDVSAGGSQPNFTTLSALFNNPNLYEFYNTTGSPDNANTYSLQENVNAYYAMMKFNIGPRIQVVGGERMEITNLAYQTQLPIQDVGRFGSKHYIDLLPSGEIKYLINEKQAIRASYYASISRPAFFELVPYQIEGDEYTEVGNPYLLHTLANNYDLRYEFFPKPSEQILAGVFYKQIYDPIELAVLHGVGPSATLEQPINVTGLNGNSPGAINYGFEFVITKYFLKNFGISANYTYTHSSITVEEQEYGITSGGGAPAPVRDSIKETRPLQGQADHIANLSLIYKNPKVGLEAQISAVYTGKLISDVSLFYEMDLWQMPMTRIDLSFEKRLSKKFKISLYGKVSNLLNTALVVRMFPPNPYQNTPDVKNGVVTNGAWLSNQDNSNGNINSIVMEKEYYGQSYLLGIRYKF